MVIECPHCLTEVLPQGDGSCPSCSGDTTIEVTQAQAWAKARIAEGDRLPRLCCTCGAETDDEEAVHAESHDGAPWWIRALALVMRPSLLFRPELRGNRVLFTIAMPRCASCQREGKLIPQHVDEPHRCMTFVVTREFKKRLERS